MGGIDGSNRRDRGTGGGQVGKLDGLDRWGCVVNKH